MTHQLGAVRGTPATRKDRLLRPVVIDRLVPGRVAPLPARLERTSALRCRHRVSYETIPSFDPRYQQLTSLSRSDT